MAFAPTRALHLGAPRTLKLPASAHRRRWYFRAIDGERGIGRRAFLEATGSAALIGLLATDRAASALAATSPSARGRFLTAHERDTLQALCAQLIPGPPTDPDPGAVEAGVPDAIDLLLGAFVDRGAVPPIHAGGPFSNRAGSRRDDFADFVPLDRHARLGWQIRIEGSRGLPDREFGGPVRGLQEVYREGLAHLDERARSTAALDFAALPFPAQTAILSDQNDAQVQELVGTALSNCFEFMYGPPEYGGNRGLVGWRYTQWPGDVQPRGYTDDQVTAPDRGSVATTSKRNVSLQRFLPGFIAPLDAGSHRTP